MPSTPDDASYAQLIMDPIGSGPTAVRDRVRQAATRRLERALPGIAAYVDVTVLSPARTVISP